MVGLTLPGGNDPTSMGIGASPPQVPITSYNGVVAISQKKLDDEKALAEAQERQAQPEIQSLATHIRTCWYQAYMHKRQRAEPQMLKSLRQRTGEYDPDKLQKIQQQGGSEVYMMITSNKCRSASSWLRDVVLGQGADRPWTCDPSPLPDLPPDVANQVRQSAQAVVQQALASGYQPKPGEAFDLAVSLKGQAMTALREEAQRRADNMADKMEDQLDEGNWFDALNDFIDDLVTFPVACLKGPVVRRRKKLTWQQGQGGTYTPVVEDKLVPEFERVSPFDIYPSPDSTGPEDGYFIERHRMLRTSLLALKGVDGYDDDAIDMVIRDYYAHGWHEWLFGDWERSQAEGRSLAVAMQNPDNKIDALQFWGSVSGRLLLDWGMDPKDIPDPLDDYEVEAWLVNTVVIKAVLNPDPLKRRPYYCTSYAKQPGGFYGNGVPDLIEDIQAVCNAAARALVNNMGIASGPQVGVNVKRLPAGEDVTQMYPWKIWQFVDDPTGTNSSSPISFFQPNPMVAELEALYDKFEQRADDYTGIPKYMVGGETTGGIGRTSSGLSMMMQNAGKAIKQVVANIDQDIFVPLLTRMYDFNMRYADDPELKGDVNIVVRGANAAVAKDAVQMRRNEFLQATANPIDMQIVGVPGRAAVLREVAKGLDMNVDKIVPDGEVLKMRADQIQKQMQMAQMAQPGGGAQSMAPQLRRNGGTPGTQSPVASMTPMAAPQQPAPAGA